MDWFKSLTGFSELGYHETRTLLELNNSRLRSKINGRASEVGTFSMTSLNDLRKKVAAGRSISSRPRLSLVQGDVREMHQASEYAGALFQVASQFNALEMIHPDVTPEHGVSGYAYDPTQGPACAIAAGAATIYRNYFVPVGDQVGQTAFRQLDGLAGVGEELSRLLCCAGDDLWDMRNGYALPSQGSLERIIQLLDGMTSDAVEALAGRLRIGLHMDVEVTDAERQPGPFVSQAFCSALPVSYGAVPQSSWGSFAQLVLDAAYEATLLAGVLNARRGMSNIVLLTRLGGGAFGNDEMWIHNAIRRAVTKIANFDLDVRLVSYGLPSAQTRALVEALA
ncbi:MULTISPECIES: hypothetical protein [unclassified Chelatococcus]|uniref:hypothetical protein n=1 Tax=unclassified Chelatococcus TaxID=2638111 RepID=UPI001BCC607B|nr:MULTISPECIES: hypothetical protein [unclassified Chelatococcus]MBS7743718.1 hypothetical protein [Chelatococcus sp. HY11]MBX3547482.1 hypothetical protein [Chelatococcus sp.]CAH1664616.1 conserved hypothetical protein [Hyphomicrobiales bacterium]CAH1688376.1 conserved hypothetical protein [Hyphomicrobiales bacterium]